MSILEDTLDFQLKTMKINGIIREFKFHVEQSSHPSRFDFAIPERKLAFEVEGGVWTGGRHTRGSGFIKDCVKYNFATLQGWRVFRFTGCMIKSGKAIDTIMKALEAL